MSLVSDLVVLVTPVPMVWSLQLSLRRGLATATSVVRLYIALKQDLRATTIARMQYKLLGTAEIGIGLICACLPTFKILWSRWKSNASSRITRLTSEVHLSSLKPQRSSPGQIDTILKDMEAGDAGLLAPSTRANV
ncbi:hypothetical protein BKA61DRAFT_658454 [Leptodontidium sp. MPI-SDFR-AT-0119]|nr:hypothetical protein BKA61DRAFT_658454 [Leptodontidium sp. MPI-SDFR-AT-0119]